MREQFPESFFCCSTWEAGKNREEAAKTKLEYNSDAEFSPTLQKNNISGSIRVPLWDSVGSRWDAVGTRSKAVLGFDIDGIDGIDGIDDMNDMDDIDGIDDIDDMDDMDDIYDIDGIDR
eukprot:jgi/Undpi1/12834/HiC_scaffold_7.g02501.m1